MSDTRLVWVDIETTGLSPTVDLMLEVGVVVTDAALNEVTSQRWAIHYSRNAIDRRLAGNSYVADVHSQSGLLDECRDSAVSTTLAEDALLQFMDHALGYNHDPGPMCGSSVHFDRAFLALRMPRLESRFHYRNLDVSGIREAVKLWAPDVMDDAPTEQKLHRVLPDLEDTLALARHLRSRLFLREVAA